MKSFLNRIFILLLCLASFPFYTFAQNHISVEHVTNTSQAYLDLLKSNKVIRKNTLMNENILDLTQVMLVDSIIEKTTQRHRVVGGAIIRMFGFKWKSINRKKEKFIATSLGEVRIPSDPLFTEYDINFNLAPHLPAYLDLAYSGYQKQQEIGKKKKHFDYNQPPFVAPEEGADMAPYKLHCELTPPVQFRPMLDNLFYPCIQPNSLEAHPNFGESHVTLGLYGAFISDCNHTCHPEIHPYEWIWWLNVNHELDNSPNKKTWFVGLMRESSNRFPKWSESPRIGKISIPISIPKNAVEAEISIHHLVFNDFLEEGLEKLDSIPQNHFDFDMELEEFVFDDPELSNLTLSVVTSNRLKKGGIVWWLSDFDLDKGNGLITGSLNFAISVNDLYTAKVEVSY